MDYLTYPYLNNHILYNKSWTLLDNPCIDITLQLTKIIEPLHYLVLLIHFMLNWNLIKSFFIFQSEC